MKEGKEAEMVSSSPSTQGKRPAKSPPSNGTASTSKAAKLSDRKACTHAVSVPEGWTLPEQPLDPAVYGAAAAYSRPAACS